METIKNYLEAMFSNMKDTPEVRRAKDELLQMMEDKYNELIENGANENTAVGTVISEFGNLDELAEDLGLKEEVETQKINEAEHPKRFVSVDEVKAFFSAKRKNAVMVAAGVFLCIISVCGPIIYDNNIGVAVMFACIALAIGMFVFSGIVMGEWEYIKKEACHIDMGTTEYAKDKKRMFTTSRALCMTVGVVLCVICWLPTVFIDNINGRYGAVSLFILVGIGVFLIVYSSIIAGGFEEILNINEAGTIAGRYNDEKISYNNKTIETVMSVYWPTVTCVYLCWSFLTFDWSVSWVIWPIAAIVNKIIQINFSEEK